MIDDEQVRAFADFLYDPQFTNPEAEEHMLEKAEKVEQMVNQMKESAQQKSDEYYEKENEMNHYFKKATRLIQDYQADGNMFNIMLARAYLNDMLLADMQKTEINERFKNDFLRIKGMEFTPDEDQTLINLYFEHKGNFRIIAQRMGRTRSACRNRFAKLRREYIERIF